MKDRGRIKQVSTLVRLLRVLYFSYYYHKTFFTVNTVDETSSTAHPYFVTTRTLNFIYLFNTENIKMHAQE